MLLLSALAISLTALYSIRVRGQKEIDSFQEAQLEVTRQSLRDLVSTAYDLIQLHHQQSEDPTQVLAAIRQLPAYTQDSTAATLDDATLLAMYGEQGREALLQRALATLAALRFDGEEGYFWVTDNQLPYPTMLMHAEKPANAGKVMSDSQYNVEKTQGLNIYQKRVALCQASGEGFVEYYIEKPGITQKFSKLSFSRLYPPLGWVVSTGIYIDQIEAMVALKQREVNQELKRITVMLVLLTLSVVSLAAFLIYRFSHRLSRDISSIQRTLKELALGKIVEPLCLDRTDELHLITGSVNDLITGFNQYSGFAKQIGEGNMGEVFQPLSEEDVLGNELLQMRDKLQQNAEEAERRTWASTGLADLSEILRKQESDLAPLGDHLLRHLATYLKINQGVLYLVADQEEEPRMQLLSCYAYGRKKFTKGSIALGEGLVGQCWFEKQALVLSEIPEDYVAITSGTGQALPRNIVILPLLYNEAVLGVLELASFRALLPHEIEFLEQISTSIGATISSVRINAQTKALLEESRTLAEELQAQEEELRQNQEEMVATNEEMQRIQRELQEENQHLRAEIAQLTTKPAATTTPEV
ncbi:HAMP domain-containing protein [Catalinimonas alkaloidigena]|uniref:HAMP domain-containing protein n=2 Tax=Catalinimonas alkaloidigena TaxID=1075417 RepID=A0A1G9UVU8_9BACT|nr:HAMP domain-containing protein [Catalinimonas alkaloidigena]